MTQSYDYLDCLDCLFRLSDSVDNSEMQERKQRYNKQKKRQYQMQNKYKRESKQSTIELPDQNSPVCSQFDRLQHYDAPMYVYQKAKNKQSKYKKKQMTTAEDDKFDIQQPSQKQNQDDQPKAASVVNNDTDVTRITSEQCSSSNQELIENECVSAKQDDSDWVLVKGYQTLNSSQMYDKDCQIDLSVNSSIDSDYEMIVLQQ
eukprot:TRINITY_DN4041_c0_g1_i4.p2 TRINITY_DN4041_c0_g1~~TRINITY_DN4041_c0_g1_i4.p2  ORF type:complete len:203 (+),score=9.77 TRINITY_DN4041_c0_g1_i4:120-728(+)